MKLLEDDVLNTLLPDLRDGSELAFNELYRICFKPLYRKIYSMVKDENIADEVVQELFVRIWQKRENLKTGENFRVYLFTIAQNLVYDYYRKVAKDLRLAAKLLSNTTDYYLHSDVLLENKESRKILLEAVEQLSPKRKEVFTRCKLQGKTYEEASHELGISVATVNTHMTHAIKIVREYLWKNYKMSALLFACSVVRAIIK